ncbi:MAG TPA: hypothetical protein VK638_43135, partial [Edaphobacter sp.]|nr:hypothetical protein [Edaphobacter sp.]
CQTRSENNGAKALNRETNNQGKGVNATTSGGQSQISRTTFINGQSRAKLLNKGTNKRFVIHFERFYLEPSKRSSSGISRSFTLATTVDALLC